jgi:DNA-binding HxlR family transcriptional regulator
VPPRTEYSLTEKGREVVPLVEQIREYGIRLMENVGA